MDAIACDAELQEKSEADLRRLAEVLQKNVDESMAEYSQKMQEDPSFDGMFNFQRWWKENIIYDKILLIDRWDGRYSIYLLVLYNLRCYRIIGLNMEYISLHLRLQQN